MNTNIKTHIIVTAMIILFGLAACSKNAVPNDTPSPRSMGQIYLYGEHHGVDAILKKEFELWDEYYHNEGMRHLFIEKPYYTAEFLNLWMKSDSDDILDTVYDGWAGTQAHVPQVKDFYKKIKINCPETIFHGTDVGHQFNTTGKRFLDYLEQNNMKDSEQYSLARKAIEQGETYYKDADEAYRENAMVENFIREFDFLDAESVMGIYGAAHTLQFGFFGAVPCMANQLREHYGEIVHSEDLSNIAHRVDSIEVGGKTYEASYFGQANLTGFKEYAYREFWRLENAYDDFKDNPKTGDNLPYGNYPMSIQTGQVFIIDYTKTDGSVIRMYYRSDGNEWEGLPSTEEFTLE